mgnify:FL=1
MNIFSLKRKTPFLIIVGILFSVNSLFSAEKADPVILDINIDYSNDPFYSEIWFWTIIASILLFLLILLIRGDRKKSKQVPEEIVELNKDSINK